MKNRGNVGIGKTFVGVAIAMLLMAGCGQAKPQSQASSKVYHTVSSSSSEDTVLWINKDGTDCDLEDFLEGDKDCKKSRKTIYYNSPKASVVSKFKTKASTVKSNVAKKVTPKINIVKKKVDATKKTASTYKKRTKSTSSWAKSSFSSSSSKSRSSSSRKRR